MRATGADRQVLSTSNDDLQLIERAYHRARARNARMSNLLVALSFAAR
jgi:hypothetical protein